MKRREFLLTGAPVVQTSQRVTWRLASSFPNALDTIYGTADVLARRVEQLTDGRFRIRPYSAGEIVPAFEVLGAVQNGTVQMGHGASYYFQGRNPALVFDCTVPFGLTARQLNAWFHYGGGLELTREMFTDFNIINFPGGNTGTQMGGWFRRNIGSQADLRGLKMRIPGLGGEVMSRLGVTVQVIPGGEIYPALERGAIDATEWVGPYDDEKLGFHEIVRDYYYPGWWEPGPGISFYVNRTAWDALPTSYQHAFEIAAGEASENMLALYDARNAPAMERLVSAGVRLHPFPEDVMAAAREITVELLEEAASDPLYGRIYASYRSWRDQAYRWFGTAELSYADFAFASARRGAS
jgi:TRAP-type mannitol/chloroaromatic compound transport system substrate-binding protein